MHVLDRVVLGGRVAPALLGEDVHHVFLQLLPLFQSEDFKEGMASFLEKRPATFTGRVSTDLPDVFPDWDEPPYA